MRTKPIRKFGARYYNRLNIVPIDSQKARALGRIIRNRGYNARVVPASKGSRIYLASKPKKDDFDTQFNLRSNSPFIDSKGSSRNVRMGLRPTIPQGIRTEAEEGPKAAIIQKLVDGIKGYEYDYLEYNDEFSKMMEDLKFKRFSNFEKLEEEEMKEIFESFSLKDLESMEGEAGGYDTYQMLQQNVDNMYDIGIDMSMGWADPNRWGGNPTTEINSTDFFNMALASQIYRFNQANLTQEANSQKKAGRFSTIRDDSNQYFANEELDLFPYLETQNIILPLQAIITYDAENPEGRLERVKLQSDYFSRLISEYRDGEFRENALIKPELEYVSRLGGYASDFDLDYYGDLFDSQESTYTYLDYANERSELEDEFWGDIVIEHGNPDDIEPGIDGYSEVINVFGVMGYKGGKYGSDIKLKNWFRFPKDPDFFDSLPSFLQNIEDYSHNREIDPDSYTAEFTNNKNTYPLQGSEVVMWRGKILLENRLENKGLINKKLAKALKLIYPNYPGQLTTEDIRNKITSDGFKGDPLVVLSFLTGYALPEITDEDAKMLVNFGVDKVYGDPFKLIRNGAISSSGANKNSLENVKGAKDTEWPDFYSAVANQVNYESIWR